MALADLLLEALGLALEALLLRLERRASIWSRSVVDALADGASSWRLARLDVGVDALDLRPAAVLRSWVSGVLVGLLARGDDDLAGLAKTMGSSAAPSRAP